MKTNLFKHYFCTKPTKMKKMNALSWSTTLLALSLLVLGCGKKENPKPMNWENTTWQRLQGEQIQFRLPNNFKRSSPEAIHSDVPALKAKMHDMLVLEMIFSKMETLDKQIDIFVDTTSEFRLLIIGDIERMDLSPKNSASVKQEMEKKYAELNALDSTRQFVIKEATRSTKGMNKMVKYKTEITYSKTGINMFQTTYFLTTPLFTTIIYEYSLSKVEIMNYLWSVKI